ncbi:hypothetical protein E2C01_029985 [Portunus trituberculatus]|uniref:Uncharacterized protein n=1 Tax=Portunus trituberculatus TaxID=210409 RepID=A0A5B7EUF9_PORTR|nr:hypothetical protein [Portunus trituberculatus]
MRFVLAKGHYPRRSAAPAPARQPPTHSLLTTVTTLHPPPAHFPRRPSTITPPKPPLPPPLPHVLIHNHSPTAATNHRPLAGDT